MKSFFKNTIVLISEIVILLLAILWYLQNKDIEPLIAIIAVGTSIILTLFFRRMKESENNGNNENEIDSKGNGNIIIQDNEGNININPKG